MISKGNKPLGTHDLYTYYKVNNGKLTKKQFCDLINEILFEIRQYVIDTGNDYFLPLDLGVIGVRWTNPAIKIKKLDTGKPTIRGLCIDWKATLDWYRNNIPELKNETIRNIQRYIKAQPVGEKMILKTFNEHTEGRVAKIRYFKHFVGARAKYHSLDTKFLKISRTFKDAVSKRIKENPDTFYAMNEISN